MSRLSRVLFQSWRLRARHQMNLSVVLRLSLRTKFNYFGSNLVPVVSTGTAN